MRYHRLPTPPEYNLCLVPSPVSPDRCLPRRAARKSTLPATERNEEEKYPRNSQRGSRNRTCVHSRRGKERTGEYSQNLPESLKRPRTPFIWHKQSSQSEAQETRRELCFGREPPTPLPLAAGFLGSRGAIASLEETGAESEAATPLMWGCVMPSFANSFSLNALYSSRNLWHTGTLSTLHSLFLMSEQPTPAPERTVLMEEQGRLRAVLHEKVETIRICTGNSREGEAYSGAPTLPPLTVTPDAMVAEALAAFDAYAKAGGDLSLLPYTRETTERYLPALRRRHATRSLRALYNDVMTNTVTPELLGLARSAVAALPKEDPLTKRTRQSLSVLLRLMRRRVAPP